MVRARLKDLIRPKKIDTSDKDVDGSYGKFVAEPLERGFGMTIGNALRRMLLSSLEGAAIVSIEVDNVSHEFSTIPGVAEDVTQLVLNLKQVVLKITDKEAVDLTLEAKGPCNVTAGMIAGDGACTVVNKDLHIATLNNSGSIKMRIHARVGRGYVIADKQKGDESKKGVIYLDSIYSPVRKVNFLVTNARVGQRTDYDKLTLEVWTNGSIDAEAAMAEAAMIMRDQLTVFVGQGLVEERIEVVKEDAPTGLNKALYRRVDEFALSVRAANCLETADIKYVGELVQKTEPEMLRTKNFGRKSLTEIKALLVELNLSLGMKLDNFPSRDELEKIREKLMREEMRSA